MKIYSVGGYDEIGKNMTCIESKGEAIILDCGIHVAELMGRDYNTSEMSRNELLGLGILPNDTVIDHLRKKVVGIVVGHGHLDHLGSVPKLAFRYDAPIVLTPFTRAILEGMLADEMRYRQSNKIISLLPGGRIELGSQFFIELIPMAHSIPDATIIAVHTKSEGTVVYALDFKFDPHPFLGHKTNEARLKQLGDKGVRALFYDTTRIEREGPTPSESVAKEKLERAIGQVKTGGIIATTFASHVARIQTLIDIGKSLNRKVFLLGRSMEKYERPAVELGLLNRRKTKIIGRSRGIAREMSRMKKKNKYLLVVTGNQGEPNSILDRMARKMLPWRLDENDHIFFSCEIIPTPINYEYREALEDRLRDFGCKIKTDLHASGHASKVGVRKMLSLVRPEHVIPTHGGAKKTAEGAKVARDEGFKDVHLLHDGEMLEI